MSEGQNTMPTPQPFHLPDFAKATKVQKAKLIDLHQSFERLGAMVGRTLAASPSSDQVRAGIAIELAYAAACVAAMKSD